MAETGSASSSCGGNLARGNRGRNRACDSIGHHAPPWPPGGVVSSDKLSRPQPTPRQARGQSALQRNHRSRKLEGNTSPKRSEDGD